MLTRSPQSHPEKKPLINKRRRNILKVLALGSGTFVLGKIFGPSLSLFGSDTNIYDFKNFRVVEDGQELGFFDKLGNEILILENDPKAGL